MPQVLVSKLSLFGLPIKMAMERARTAGFDGIEVSLTNRFKDYVWRCQYLAKKLDLTLHFHQAWSSDEDPTDWKFKILEWVGYLPQSGYILSDNVPCDITQEPVVIQADRLSEIHDLKNVANNFWFQTDSVVNKHREIKMRLTSFLEKVRQFNLPVVFDTQHYLEWRLGVFRDLSKLPTNPARLFELLEEGWTTLGSHTKEIHLNDWQPGNRNVFPGTGVAPLTELCQLVKSTGWNGCVVPEISPSMPMPHSQDTLKRLRDTVDSYFA